MFDVKKRVLETLPFFSSILGRSEHSTQWAHMQSVRACAVQTHFLVFVPVLKNSSPKTATWLNSGVVFGSKCDICVKKGVPETASKKRDPPDSNGTLFACQEAPGDAASRAHFSNKKQLFEQQFKHCSVRLQKKVNWIRCWCCCCCFCCVFLL